MRGNEVRNNTVHLKTKMLVRFHKVSFPLKPLQERARGFEYVHNKHT